MTQEHGSTTDLQAEATTTDVSGGFLGEPLPGVAGLPAAVVNQLSAAWQAREQSYEPRTRHLLNARTPKFTNRLFLTTSPYLRQHAHNPVNWFPWGREAFDLAKKTGRPILLSVGYSTCHWCHVMEEESFEDIEIAEFLNRHYVAIKVDREQRPDVDGVYMTVVQMLTGRGGWPMTVVMTADGKPFFGGTYFPPRDGLRGRQKGFLTLLKELSTLHTQQRDKLDARGEKITTLLQQATQPSVPGDMPQQVVLDGAVQRLSRAYDPAFGGFSPAPKFPRPSIFGFLLAEHHRTGANQLRDMVTYTLTKMANGGIHDQLGGGFHRYSTDTMWLVPHFEKMLYDNAQLATAYLQASRASENRAFATITRKTLDYVSREMTAPAGGFYSATDADSTSAAGHREEGVFFTWTPAEIRSALPADQATAVLAYYDIQQTGNFEGRSIPHRPRAAKDVADTLGISPEQLQQHIEQARAPLLAERAKRPAPLRDDKIITSWNGLMISAFAQAGLYLNDAGYRRQATAAATFVWDHLRGPNNRLYRNFHRGRAQHMGVLDDYASIIQAYLDLLSASSDTIWLTRAVALTEAVETHFADPNTGAYFLTPDDREVLLTREVPNHDGAEPSGNSVMAHNLLRLATITGEQRYRTRAEKLLAAFAEDLEATTSLTHMHAALSLAWGRPLEILIVLPEQGGDPSPLLAELASVYLPNTFVFTVKSGAALAAASQHIPALAGRTARGGKPTAYVCEQGRCQLPTTEAKTLGEQLRSFGPKPTPNPDN